MSTKRRRASLGWIGLCCALAIGCGGSPIERTVDSLQGIVDVMKTVRDPASATAAVPKLTPAYQQAIDAVKELATDKSSGAGSITALAELMQRVISTIQALENETKRLDDLKGLPVEFWDVARMQTIRLASAMAGVQGEGSDVALAGAIQQVAAMHEQLGPSKIVELRLRNASQDPTGAINKVRDIVGPDVQVIELTDPSDYEENVAYLGPIDDFDALVSKLTIGEIVEHEKACGEIIIRMPDPSPEELQYAGMSPEQIAETKAQEEAAKQAEEEAAAETARQEAAEQEKNRIETMFATPDKKSPEYHSQLLQHLADPQSTLHQQAVEGLLALAPEDVSDKQIRGEVARQFRKLATESTDRRGDAIRGLVVWGGKYSVPLLLELLKSEQATEKEVILAGLGEHPTPEGAAAAAEHLIEATNREHAIACLTKMGSLAEDAVLAKLPAEDEAASLAGVTLLGDIGTEKSAKLLRRAAKSEKPEMKEAAVEAYKKIREREKEAKDSAKQAAN